MSKNTVSRKSYGPKTIEMSAIYANNCNLVPRTKVQGSSVQKEMATRGAQVTGVKRLVNKVVITTIGLHTKPYKWVGKVLAVTRCCEALAHHKFDCKTHQSIRSLIHVLHFWMTINPQNPLATQPQSF